MKVECGQNFTRKIEGMFNDIDTSTSLMTIYKQNRDKNAVDINFTGNINDLIQF
jgi:hypothetical protein